MTRHSLTIYFCLLIVAVVLSSGCLGQPALKAVPVPSNAFKVPADFNGFNTQMMRGPSWDAPGFADQVKSLHPAIIRYPGGTVASYWDWKTGWLMKGIELRRDWANLPPNPVTVNDLRQACESVGAVPLLVLNMMNSTLEYQMEFLRAVKKAGLPVKYIELDNEIYLGEEFYVKKYPSGREYAADANNWIAAIKKEFPDAAVAVVGCAEKEIQNANKKKYEGRTNTWNRDVLSVLKSADAMTFHVYGGSGLNALTKMSGEEAGGDQKAKAQAYQTAFDKAGSEVPLLGIPFSRWKTSVSYDYAVLPSGMKAWITEYNLFEKEGVMAGTWMHGLYALMQSLLFMEDPRTGRICYHNLTTSAQFAAIFNNTEGFEKSEKQKPTALFGLTAAGHTLSFFGEAMNDAATVVPLKITGVASQRSFRGQDYPSVYGVMASGKNRYVLLVNLTAKPVSVDVSGVWKGSSSWKQIYSGIRTQVAADSDVRSLKGTGSTVKLEPFAVALVKEGQIE